jgi:AcrR family transcriptional regulator
LTLPPVLTIMTYVINASVLTIIPEMTERSVMSQQHKPGRKISRRHRRASATRQKLLTAARAIFAEKGLDLTRIDEITERADVGKGTFYYHFRTKDRIILEVIKDVLDELVAVIEERCNGITDLQALLHALIGAHMEFFSSRWEDFVLYFLGRTELTLEESYEGIETPFLNYLERIEDLLASVIKYRLPRPALRRIAGAVAGFVTGHYAFALIGSQEDIEQSFISLRSAIVASLASFIQTFKPPDTAGQENEEPA